MRGGDGIQQQAFSKGWIDEWMDYEWTDGLTDELTSFLERSLSSLDYRGEAGGENISQDQPS